ncbi:MAG: hypothetical protein ACREAR_05455 [Nitrosotalea sp.]
MRKYVLPSGLLIVGFAMVLYGWLFPYVFFPCHNPSLPCVYDETLPYFIEDLGYFIMAGGGIWIGIIRRAKKYVLPVSVLIVGFAMVLYGWISPHVITFCLATPCGSGDNTIPYFIAFFGYFVIIGSMIWMAGSRRQKIPAKSF